MSFYEEVYDMVDVLIVKAKTNEKILITLIKELLDAITKGSHIIYRLLIYVAVYYIKITNVKHKLFVQMFINKINEFENKPTIDEYFMKEELISYRNELISFDYKLKIYS